MKKRILLNILAVLLSVSMLASPFLGVDVAAETFVNFSFSPSTVTKNNGEDYWITINISNVIDLTQYSLRVNYDPAVVQVMGGEGGAGITAGKIIDTSVIPNMTYDLPMTWNYVPSGTPGVVLINGDLAAATGMGANGSGFVAKIHLQVIGSPGQTTNLTISSISLKNTLGGNLNVGAIGSAKVSVLYPPVTVSIAVPDNVIVGEEFTATVNISLINNLHAYQFEITYDPAVIEIIGLEHEPVGVTDGNISGTPLPISSDHSLWSFSPTGTQGKVRVTVLLWGSQVTGIGYLAQIHFRVLSGGGGNTSLTFTGDQHFENTLLSLNDGVFSGVTWQNVTFPIVDYYRITTRSPLPSGEVGISYVAGLAATNGVPPYTYSLAGGSPSLPNGLSLGSNGVISGTPTTAGGPTLVNFQVTDNTGATATKVLSITVYPRIAVSTGALPNGYVGIPYSRQLTASGGSGNNTWSIAGSLPGGLTLNPTTGVISGTPTTDGTSVITVQVSDGLASATRLLTLTIKKALTITTTSLSNGNINTYYSQTLAASGGSGVYAWSISTGSLPAWATLSNGTISGMPTVKATTAFTVMVNDGVTTVTRPLSITINTALSITTTSLATGYIGGAYSQALVAAGGSLTYSWSIISGSLPSGLTLTGNTIAGTPTESGTFNIRAQVNDGIGVVNRDYVLTINEGLSILTEILATGNAGTAYSQALAAGGGLPPYTWSVAGTPALPAGLTLAAATGVISGTPTAAFGPAQITFKVTDNASPVKNSATRAVWLTVNGPLAISTSSLPRGNVGSNYSQTLAATGGNGAYTWSIYSGSLPAGLALNGNTISGIPTTKATYNFTVRVTDGISTVNKSLSIIINSALVISTVNLAGGNVGTAYSQTLAASGGSLTYNWSIIGGSLPPGLTLTGSTIGGTPTAAGTFSFTLQVNDGLGIVSQEFSIAINPVLSIVTSSLANGNVGAYYSQTLAASGGSGVYTWSITGSITLPTGLILSGNSIAGTPTVSVTRNVSFRVSDGISTATVTLPVTINAALVINTTTLPNGNIGIVYNQSLTATGGSGAYTWSISQGSLPGGLTLTGNTISGTPAAGGASTFTVQVNDGISSTGKVLTLTVNQPLSVSTTALADGNVGTAYSQTLAANGGTGTYNWSIIEGSLPGGLTLAATTGKISGTPAAGGTSTFTVRVNDGVTTAARQLTIKINAALAIVTTSLSNGNMGTAYSQTLAASGGSGVYSWSISTGSLPVWATLSNGTISGTPTARATTYFTVMVNDGISTVTRSLSIAINYALSITTTSLATGYIGGAYSQALAATGGSGTYIWNITSGSLPGGLTLNGNTIGGIPTASGTFNITAQVNDGIGTAARDYTLTINTGLSISTETLATGNAGTAYSQTLAAAGGLPPYTWSVAGTPALPTGLTLGAATGVISGTPTAAFGPAQITFKVTDNASPVKNTATKAIWLTINGPLTITTSSLPRGDVGSYYSQTLTATGGNGGYTWSITGLGSLPAGLTLEGNTISGIPTTKATYTFTVRVSDGIGSTTKSFSVIINSALTITTVNLAGGNVGTAYSQTLAASGGSLTYNWNIIEGSLPGGLTLSGNRISGTPTTPGTYSFTLQVNDGIGTVSQEFSITINPVLSIVTSSMANGNVGAYYSQTLAASGGSGVYTWSITGSITLPTGLTLSGNSIAGTPTVSVTKNVTFKVSDGISTATVTLPVKINAALVINTTTLPNGNIGIVYNQALTATGGSGAYTWSISQGSLPGGLTLTGNTISGTPAAGGASTFTVQVDDGISSTGKVLTLTVNQPLSVSTTALADGNVGTAYSQTLAASGGTGTYTWSIIEGSLPGGLTLAATTGKISGTPAAGGTSTFTVRVNDGVTTAARQLTIKINVALAIVTTSLSNGNVGTAYSQTLAASGGSGVYSWSISTGSLPSGLTLSGNTISGTPTTKYTYSFTVRVTDGISTVTRSLSIAINTALSITTTSLATGYIGGAYSQALAATGGAGILNYSWSIISGSLPGGLTLNGNTIGGIPSASGTFNITAQVNDGIGTASRDYTLTINTGLSISTETLATGNAGTAYSQALAAAGGLPPYTWSVAGTPALPSGLTLGAATGVISGTPTAAFGPAQITFKVTDNASPVKNTTTKAVWLTINGPLAISTSSLPRGDVGSYYSQTLSATGGNGAYTWSISGGSLPSGLTLEGNTISGTPSAIGTSTFTVKVQDGISNLTRSLSITVNSALVLTTASLPGGVVGNAYNQALAATGGSGTYNWSIIGGSLPSGLTLYGSTISGTPTSDGTFNFSVQVNDGIGSVSKAFSIVVNGALSIITTTLPNSNVGVSYNQTLQAAGGNQPYTWSIQGTTALPTGMLLNASTGAITGTPTTNFGPAAITFKVTDSTAPTPNTASRSISLTINRQLSVTTTALANGNVNTAYSQTLNATGGSGNYIWTIVGSLPSWASLNGNVISGTPGTPGTSSFSVRVNDGISTATRQLSISINSALSITTTALPAGVIGIPYSQALAAAGGTGSYTWSISSGSLPAWAALNGNTISGTPNAIDSTTFIVRVSDSIGVAVKQLTININPVLSIDNENLPEGFAGTAYLQTLTATGGIAPYTWLIQGTGLPDNLTLNSSTGEISGLPNAAFGPANITFKVTDSASPTPNTAVKTLSLMVNGYLSVITASLPGADVNSPYSQALNASGGSGSYTWSIVSGNFPAWASLNGNLISGNPNVTGTHTFSVQVNDGKDTAEKQLSITVNPALLITTTALANGNVNAAYSQTLAVQGGSGSYSWSVISGELPEWALLDGHTIAGTPSLSGTTVFTVQVNDGIAVVSRQLQITINPALVISTSALPNADLEVLYSQTLQATGGSGSYTWTVVSGSLPEWASLDGNLISGTPHANGTSNFTVRVNDGIAVVNKVLSITVNPAVLTIISASPLPGGQLNTSYYFALEAAGGVAPYNWSIEGTPGLPSGLILDSTGVISGKPSGSTGLNLITFKVTDSATPAAVSVIKQLALTIYSAGSPDDAPVVFSPSTRDVKVGETFTLEIKTANGTAQEVSGVDLFINFDPEKLEVVDANTSQSGIQIASGAALPVVLTNQADNAAGVIHYSAGKYSPYPGGPITVATVTFLARSPTQSTTSISFSFEDGQKTIVDYIGTALEGTHQNASITIALSGEVDIIASLQGSSRPDTGFNIPFTAHFYTPGADIASAAPLYSFTLTGSKSGNKALFHCAGILPGDYDISLSSPHTLSNVMRGVNVPDHTVTVDMGILLEGNANDDGTINIQDFGILSGSYFLKSGDSGFDARADFNRDGVVNILDFSLLSANYQLSSPRTVSLTVTEGAFAAAKFKKVYAESLVDLALAPSEITLNPGDTRDIKLMAQTNGHSVAGIDAFISFDPAYCEVLSITSGTSLDKELLSGIDPEQGVVKYSAGLLGTSSYPDQDFEVAVLKIKIKDSASETQTGLEFSTSGEYTTCIAFDGKPILGNTSGTLINIQSSTIPTLTIETSNLESILENTDVLQTLEAAGGVGPYYWLATGLPDGLTCSTGGVISGQAVLPGDYQVTIFVYDSLVPAGSASRVMTLKVYMRYDVNGDGEVNMGDVVRIQKIFMGLSPCTPAADANQDGIVDPADIIKVIRYILFMDP